MRLYFIITCLAAAALVLLLMPMFIPFLKKKKMGQTIYELGPKEHLSKQGTPNMGGVITGGVTIAILIAVTAVRMRPFFVMDQALWPLLLAAVGGMAIGFADDYIKDIKKDREGLKPKQKIMGQIVLGVLLSVYCYFYVGHDIVLPFTTKTWDLGIFYIPIMTLLVIFITNSTNLQDGVDGILSSVAGIGMLAFGVIAAYTAGQLASEMNSRTIAVLCFAVVGVCAGFLKFNKHPAQIFMGDTGSMFIGGAMVGAAMLLKCQFLLIPIAFTSIMSSVSVMMQVSYFKYTKKKYGEGRRIFKMSPIHHHFQQCGMSEERIVAMYALVTLALSALAVFSVRGFFNV